MEENDKKMFKEIVENIFVRWTALKLAVEHGMGGKSGQQVNTFQPNQTLSPVSLEIFKKEKIQFQLVRLLWNR